MSEEDNRKRVHQQDENDAANSSKRAAIVQGGVQDAGNGEETEPFYFKLLCPQGITGLIIGKGGANIIQLNATTGARIKLSQNNEYFPNTTDRILLISGGKQGMENAIRELVSRIVEAPEKRQAPGEFLKQQTAPRPSGTYTIRVLIPKIASAAVIGKGGVVIKRMSEQSGCRFQLGEENDPFNTNERIVTITGTSSPSVVTGAIHIMFQLLDEAPRIRTYTNPTTNYSGRSGAPHQGAPQNIPHHMMGGQPPAAMMAPPGFVPYGAVPPPYVLQYPHMGQIQVPMQQAMFPQGMAPQSGFPMQAAQFPMGGTAPGGYVAAPAPMAVYQFTNKFLSSKFFTSINQRS
eukprot:gene209-141_t